MNPAKPAPGTTLCRLDEVKEPGAKSLLFRNGPYAWTAFVVRKDGRVLAYRDVCPHAGLPLAPIEDKYLTREKDLILCSVHGALFDIATGACRGGPCPGQALTPVPITVADGLIRMAGDPARPAQD